MIRIQDKQSCCCCGACVQRCPKHCIFLQEDDEGFLYPKVDEVICINCGLCEKVCPILNRAEQIEPLKVLAAKNNNEEERMNSSSGGVFMPLAREVINKKGVVFGAVYDEHWEVHHVYAEKIEEVYPMMGSKYLQSRIENTYKEAEQFLKQGRDVMFVGSPCQIAGLRTFLRNKEYPNLLLVDFLCHGVPSPGVWRRYLAETYATTPIGDINFRDKRKTGWAKYRFVVKKQSLTNENVDKNIILTSENHSANTFMQGFLSDIFLRPSCYGCKCKNGVSHSDLTIGDFWGIAQIAPEFDDDKGVGLVLVNSEKGGKIFSKLSFDILSFSLEEARRNNGGFNESTSPNPKRNQFFSQIENGITIKTAVAICLQLPLKQRIIFSIKKLIKCLFSDREVDTIKRIIKR